MRKRKRTEVIQWILGGRTKGWRLFNWQLGLDDDAALLRTFPHLLSFYLSSIFFFLVLDFYLAGTIAHNNNNNNKIGEGKKVQKQQQRHRKRAADGVRTATTTTTTKYTQWQAARQFDIIYTSNYCKLMLNGFKLNWLAQKRQQQQQQQQQMYVNGKSNNKKEATTITTKCSALAANMATTMPYWLEKKSAKLTYRVESCCCCYCAHSNENILNFQRGGILGCCWCCTCFLCNWCCSGCCWSCFLLLSANGVLNVASRLLMWLWFLRFFLLA